MEYQGEGVILYIDKIAENQQGRYDPFKVIDHITKLEEVYPIRQSLMPFLAEMCANDLIIGMDHIAYERVVHNRSLPFTKQKAAESILEDLVEKGLLRRVKYQERMIYFPSERMLH